MDQKEPRIALGLELWRRPEDPGAPKGRVGAGEAKLPWGSQASLSGDKSLGSQGFNQWPLRKH